MSSLRKITVDGLILFFISSILFFSSFLYISAEEIDWIEVAKINNAIQFIDVKSIKYNNTGYLSVLNKYSEIDPQDSKFINTDFYLMAIDCENRLYSKLPLNGNINQVKNWIEPIDDKLIKKTIISSCLY
tara:strand:- start:109 stop:498 length:390 start_codon:yes stop_codon:yes gene_type:complete